MKDPGALSDMASDDVSPEPRPESGLEASTAAQGEGDARSVSDATNLLTRRLRVAETTVEALEAALARKERLLGEAAERERALCAALDAARLEPDASPGPTGSETKAPGSAGADASAETTRAAAAAGAWRERALTAESARETAANAARRLGDENRALRSILERARDAETAETRDGAESAESSGGKTRASPLGAEIRAAVAEGALATSRARAEEAESALGAWQAHARELMSRLERAERRVTRQRGASKGSGAGAGDDDDDDDDDGGATRGGAPLSAATALNPKPSLADRPEETERLSAASFLVTEVRENHSKRASSVLAGPAADPAGGDPAEDSETIPKRATETRATRATPFGTDGDDSSGGARRVSAADAASSALTKALAKARRVAETAERRGAAGAAALERARVLERAAAAKLARLEVGT